MLSATGEELSEFGTSVGDGSPVAGLAGGGAAGSVKGADAMGVGAVGSVEGANAKGVGTGGGAEGAEGKGAGGLLPTGGGCTAGGFRRLFTAQSQPNNTSTIITAAQRSFEPSSPKNFIALSSHYVVVSVLLSMLVFLFLHAKNAFRSAVIL